MVGQNSIVDRFVDVFVVPETRLDNVRFESLNRSKFFCRLCVTIPDPLPYLTQLLHHDFYNLGILLGKIARADKVLIAIDNALRSR